MQRELAEHNQGQFIDHHLNSESKFTEPNLAPIGVPEI